MMTTQNNMMARDMELLIQGKMINMKTGNDNAGQGRRNKDKQKRQGRENRRHDNTETKEKRDTKTEIKDYMNFSICSPAR